MGLFLLGSCLTEARYGRSGGASYVAFYNRSSTITDADSVESSFIESKRASSPLISNQGVVCLCNMALSIGDAHFLSLQARAGLMTSLVMHRCTLLGDCLASILIAALSVNSQVEHISLHHCNLNEVVLSRMKVYAPQFEEKDASIEENGENTEKLLSAELPKKRGKGLKLACNPRLKVLDLSFAHLDSRAFKALSVIVSQSLGLETLVLDRNAMNNDELRNIVHSLRRHPSLANLYLSGCQLGDAAMEYIAFGLKSNGNISTLDISCNEFTSLGLQVFLNAAQQGACRNLVELDLSYNELGGDGILALSKIITQGKLPKLESIVLRQVGATQTALLSLIEAVSSGATHSVLRRFDISGNELNRYKVAKKSGTYADKLGKKLGVDISKYAGKSASEVLSSTAAAATPLINDGLAKLSSGFSGLSSMIESGADVGLKILSGEDFDEDAGIIDATDPRGYGYGVTYGKSRKSSRYNAESERKRKRKRKRRGEKRKGAKRKGKRRGTGRVLEATVVRQARKKAEGPRQGESSGEEGPPGEKSPSPTLPQRGRRRKARRRGRVGGKTKKALKSATAVVQLLTQCPCLEQLGLAQCGINDKWCRDICSEVQARSAALTPLGSGGKEEEEEKEKEEHEEEEGGAPISVLVHGFNGGRRAPLTCLLSLNGLKNESIVNVTNALQIL